MVTSPVGTMTLDSLMLELCTKLWTKKDKELKNARVVRADIKVQETHEVHDKLEGMLRDSGDFMNGDEKLEYRRKLFELRKQSVIKGLVILFFKKMTL